MLPDDNKQILFLCSKTLYQITFQSNDWAKAMMTSSNANIVLVTGPLCGAIKYHISMDFHDMVVYRYGAEETATCY